MTLERNDLLDVRLRLPEHVVHRSFISETVLLNLQTGNYHGLNPVGGVMLETVNEAPSVRQRSRPVADKYNQDPAVVEPDLLALCQGLVERGLMEVAEARPGEADMTGPLPPLRILHDQAGLWSRAAEILREPPVEAEEAAPWAWSPGPAPPGTRFPNWTPYASDHDGPSSPCWPNSPRRAVPGHQHPGGGSACSPRIWSARPGPRCRRGGGTMRRPSGFRSLLARPALSPRERQVLAMVVLDFSNAEIARKLVVTESNVKAILTSAFSKLGVTSRNAAAELILDEESGLGPGILRFSSDETAGEDLGLPDVGQGFRPVRRPENGVASGAPRPHNRA